MPIVTWGCTAATLHKINTYVEAPATGSSLLINAGKVKRSHLTSFGGEANTHLGAPSVGDGIDRFFPLSRLVARFLGNGGFVVSGFLDVSCVIPVTAILIGRGWRGVGLCRIVTELVMLLELCWLRELPGRDEAGR